MRVDLWTWSLSGGDARLLSADERQRAERFVRPQDRARYVAGRSRLRAILGRYLGRPPGELRFAYGPHGRPMLAGVGFSLAHAEELAALAVGPEPTMGLDIERRRPVDAATARQYLSASEQAEVEALPAGTRDLARLRAWTRKEAVMKALGFGLAGDFTRVEVTTGPEARLRACPDGDAWRWSLREVSLGPEVVAALAVRADGATVEVVERCWDEA